MCVCGGGGCSDESYIDLGSPRLKLQRDTLEFTRVNFSTLSVWCFNTADKSFVPGPLLKMVHGG